jgi:hypothetical protein
MLKSAFLQKNRKKNVNNVLVYKFKKNSHPPQLKFVPKNAFLNKISDLKVI